MVRTALTIFAVLLLGASDPPPQATLIRGARMFDGTGAPAAVSDVLVRGDRIAAVAHRLRIPAGARVIEARGLTLIPGLHDLHTHTGAAAYRSAETLRAYYADYLADGITTVDEFSAAGPAFAAIRQLTADPEAAAPHILLATRVAVPGGHGADSPGTRAITVIVSSPAEAHAAMTSALQYRPDLVKVFADGWRYGRDRDNPSMDEPTLAAIVADAHRAGLRVVTHTVTLARAKLAARAGVDALAHGIGDALVDDELLALMKRSGMAYIPTLSAYEPWQLRDFSATEWAALRPAERACEEQRRASEAPPVLGYDARRWRIMRENVLRLKAAGVPIGIGTDAGVPDAFHASTTLREIRMLTGLGFSPAAAIVAATSTSAAILHQPDHGRIAAGQRADLVLTGGRPDERIDDLHDVRRVFVGGRELALSRPPIDRPERFRCVLQPQPLTVGQESSGE